MVSTKRSGVEILPSLIRSWNKLRKRYPDVVCLFEGTTTLCALGYIPSLKTFIYIYETQEPKFINFQQIEALDILHNWGSKAIDKKILARYEAVCLKYKNI